MVIFNTHTTRTKNVSFYDHNIFTVVTKDPNIVTAWIAETIEISHGGRLVIGLDIEWRPNYDPGVEHPVATLQLCVGHRCLIFQIIHAPFIPQSLFYFLNNPNYIFTGVGVQADAGKLVRHYNLGGADFGTKLAANFVDLVRVATQAYGLNKKGLGLKKLAGFFLGKEPEKPKWVSTSNWDNPWLTEEQIDYATIDAFVSFQIGWGLIQA